LKQFKGKRTGRSWVGRGGVCLPTLIREKPKRHLTEGWGPLQYSKKKGTWEREKKKAGQRGFSRGPLFSRSHAVGVFRRGGMPETHGISMNQNKTKKARTTSQTQEGMLGQRTGAEQEGKWHLKV